MNNMDVKDNVTENLKVLIDVFDFNVNTLSNYLGLSTRQVEELAKGHINFLPEDPQCRFCLFTKIMFLYCVAIDDKDLKLEAFLKVLISYHHISKNTIAKMAGAETKDIDKILESKGNEISDKIKYKLAVTSMSLRFCLKDCENDNM